jgi:hypothetical protein
MTTLNHTIPLTGPVPQVTQARGVLATIAENAYLRLFAVLVVIAAGAAVLVMAIGLLLNAVLPVVFANELHALAALFPLTSSIR